MSLEISKDLSIDDLLTYANQIRKKGDLFMIKFDGQRQENFVTVLISFANLEKDVIRFDGSDLKELLIKTIKEYYR